jgi:hypothetical protein
MRDVELETILCASKEASDLLGWDGDSGRRMSFDLDLRNLVVFREAGIDTIGAGLRSNRVHFCVWPSVKPAEEELTGAFLG